MRQKVSKYKIRHYEYKNKLGLEEKSKIVKYILFENRINSIPEEVKLIQRGKKLNIRKII